MEKFISVIIPNYRDGKTLGKCLQAVFASNYQNFEVIVVDDCSDDDSIEIIKGFPCKMVRLGKHAGAARARNIGAAYSSGEVLFFTDADCLLQEDTLMQANQAYSLAGPNVVIGGTYTPIPHDQGFFSVFQSVFVNYSESKEALNPDYIATHAMIIDAHSFLKSGGFSEKFLPILEDVEFSHRLQRAGYRLVMTPDIQVRHIFNFSLYRSLRNAITKSMYWTMYSLKHGDVLADSGTASIGLKTNVVACFISLLLILVFVSTENIGFLLLIPFLLTLNLFVNRGLLAALYHTNGLGFALTATFYYLLPYSVAVGAGALAGVASYPSTIRTLHGIV